MRRRTRFRKRKKPCGGPGSYYRPNSAVGSPRLDKSSPSFSMGIRPTSARASALLHNLNSNPGPGSYNVSRGLGGPKVSMAQKYRPQSALVVPGPGSYNPSRTAGFHSTGYTMGGRSDLWSVGRNTVNFKSQRPASAAARVPANK
eukprot:comp15285_c0_seq2/m.23063 comp15285_c0_seq2/g.23063  ORF comp15285_c0_seq2/g.23063 comp15285_c0_seq2/m.23063 type:complete len:145 (-) comp15285_c0_seq2:133-567(-)